MFFTGVTKNLNWEILTENIVTFKRWDGAKNEKFYHHGDSQKNLMGGGGHEKPINRGELPKRGASTVCRFKGGLAKKREGVFLRGGGLIHQCILWSWILQYIL